MAVSAKRQEEERKALVDGEYEKERETEDRSGRKEARSKLHGALTAMSLIWGFTQVQ